MVYALNHSGARLLVNEPERFAGLETLRPRLPGVEHYYVTGGHPEFAWVDTFDELLCGSALSANRPFLPAEESAAAIYYTSGTTGLPKAVVHTHGSLREAARNQIQQIGISADDITLVMFPVCYLIGFGSQVVTFLSCGATCVLLPYFEPGLALKAMEAYQHPSVQDAGVVGVLDGRGGEFVQAHVVLNAASPPVTPQGLIDFTKSRLAGYKVPGQVILAESLPYGLTGKIDRMALRKDAQERSLTRWPLP